MVIQPNGGPQGQGFQYSWPRPVLTKDHSVVLLLSPMISTDDQCFPNS